MRIGRFATIVLTLLSSALGVCPLRLWPLSGTVALQRKGGDPSAAKQADDAWLHSLLALIGEQFGPDSDEICGIVIGPRAKETRLALWTKTGDDEQTCKRIGAFFKANIRHEGAISYQLHDESIKKQTSYRNEAVYKV